MPIIFIFLLLHRPSIVASCLFKSAGENAAREIRYGLDEATQNIDRSLENTATTITSSIDNAVSRLEQLGTSVAAELGGSIRQASRDLVWISYRVTNSIDKGVEEMTSVIKEAINTTHQITDRLLSTADKAIDKIDQQIQNAIQAVREISSDLATSIDKGFEELGKSLRHIGDKIAEVAKQIEVKIDSNHLVGVANATGEALVKSVQELTTNWELAVNTADFKDIGQGAAAELSKALQNLKVNLQVQFGMDDNMRRAVMYIAIAMCVAFYVCFVAMIIALKSCRSCTAKLVGLIIQKCRSASSNDNDENIEAPEVQNASMSKVKLNNKAPKANNLEETLLKKKANMKVTSDYNSDSESDDDSFGDNGRKQGGFNKRESLSLADYNAFPEVKGKWERRATKSVGKEWE